jgi:CRISPR-associated exonuclease Cas4
MYYYHVCHRKLWYFMHQLEMESGNEAVLIGKTLDESSYQRVERHINIDNVISIDFIKEKNIIHEIKKSRKIEEASIWQVKYYLFYLKHLGLEGIYGQIDYPLLRQTITVELTDDDERTIISAFDDINRIGKFEHPPIVKKTGICNKCAYYDLCYI